MTSGRLAKRFVVAVIAVSAGAAATRADAPRVLLVKDATDDVNAPSPDSFRDLVERQAQPGDTVRFEQPIVVELAGGVFVRTAGLRIEGPGELRVSKAVKGRIRPGQLGIESDGVTVSDMSFTNVALNAAGDTGGISGDDVDFVSDLHVLDCRFFQAATIGLQFVEDAEVLRCHFEPHHPNGRAIPCIVADDTRRLRIANCDTAVSDDGTPSLAEGGGTGLVVEDNQFAGPVGVAPLDGVVRRNKAPGQFIAVNVSFHPDEGHVTVEDNECGGLLVGRIDADVLRNQIDTTGAVAPLPASFVRRYPKSELQTALSVVASAAGSTSGRLVVADNVVHGGTLTGLSVVQFSPNLVGAEVARNHVFDAGTLGIVLNAKGATFDVHDNEVRRSGAAGPGNGIRALASADGMSLHDDQVLDTKGAGIALFAGAGHILLTNEAVKGSTAGAGVTVGNGRAFAANDCVVEGNSGPGWAVGTKAKGTIEGGSARGNGAAGVQLASGTLVAIDAVAFGGNAGAGIDLFPPSVTPNAKPKKANANLDWPDELSFDQATGKVTGRTLPRALVQGYAVEDGARAGNPANGEGAAFLGEVVAGDDGRFTWPGSGRAPCPSSKKLTFTATLDANGAHTSEFSEDVECSGGTATERVSVASGGAEGDDRSDVQSVASNTNRVVTPDGRFVVFTSDATDLVAGDTNTLSDVFVRDRQAGTTVRASLTASGAQIDRLSPDSTAGSSQDGSISADGRFVAFVCDGQDVAVAAHDAFQRRVYVRDLVAGATLPVSDPQEPAPNEQFSRVQAYDPSISADGSSVAFVTGDPDWDPRDQNGSDDVFVWTRAAGSVEMVSLTASGAPSTDTFFSLASTPRLSADGRYVAFVTTHHLTPGDTVSGAKVFVRDRQAGTTVLVSRTSAGAPAGGEVPSISDDGRKVAFVTRAALVPEDTDGAYDVYVRDLDAGTTTLASLDAQGQPFLADTIQPSLSGDGRFVAFRGPGGHTFASGFTAIFQDVWVRDLQLGTTVEGSVGETDDSDAGSNAPALSADGRFLVFASFGTNLVPGDTNGKQDVFVRDRASEIGQ